MSLVINKMQIKTKMRCHFVPIKVVTIFYKRRENNESWRGYGKIRTLLHCWKECKMVDPLWKTVWEFLHKINIYVNRPNNSVPRYILQKKN
jgi:hypothetical protein